MFHGALTDADVTIQIADGTLSALYNGRFSRVDPAVALDDPRFASVMTGAADVQTTVRQLLTGTPELPDYEISGTATLDASNIRGVPIAHADYRGELRAGSWKIAQLTVQAPAIAGRASGTIAFVSAGATALDYDITRLDAGDIRIERPASRRCRRDLVQGIVATKGRRQWPVTPRCVPSATATVTNVNASGFEALDVDGHYDITVPSGAFAQATACLTARASFPVVFGQPLQQLSGSFTMAGERIGVDVQLAQAPGRTGAIKGDAFVDLYRRTLQLSTLTLTFGNAPWQLSHGPTLPPSRGTHRGSTCSRSCCSAARHGTSESKSAGRGATTGAAR